MRRKPFIDLGTLENEACGVIHSIASGVQGVGFDLDKELTGFSVLLDRDGWAIVIISQSDDAARSTHLVLKSKTGFQGTLGEKLSKIRSKLIELNDFMYKIFESFNFKTTKENEIKIDLLFEPEENSVNAYLLSELFIRFSRTKDILLTSHYDSEYGDDLTVSFVVKDRRDALYLPVSRKSFASVAKFTKGFPAWLEECINKHISLDPSVKPSAQVMAPKNWRCFRCLNRQLVSFDRNDPRGQVIELPIIYKRKKITCVYLEWLEKDSVSPHWHNFIEFQRNQGSFLCYTQDHDVIEVVPIELALKILNTYGPGSELLHILELVSQCMNEKKSRSKP
jgi:hypothetical protein